MRVRVSFFGDVQRHVKGGAETLEPDLPEGATVGDLLAQLGVDAIAQLTIGVNGDLAGLEAGLREGDRVMLVTPMEGG